MLPSAAASAFFGAAEDPPPAPCDDEAGRRVLALVDRARARRPGVVGSAPRFVARFVARLGALAGGSLERAEALHVADLWLALAVSDGERCAFDVFEREVASVVLEALRRRGVDEVEREEVAQRVRAEFLVPGDGQPAALLRYAGRAPLHRWLTVAAARMLERARGPVATDELDEDDVIASAVVVGADVEARLVRAEAKQLLAEALRHAVAALDRDDRVLLRMHVNDHLGIDDLSRLFGMHRATAARHLERARRQLAQRTRSYLAARVALPPWEIDSLLRVVRSSFRSLVGTYLASSRP